MKKLFPISGLQQLEISKRNAIIREIKAIEGVTIRQLSRIIRNIKKCN